MTSNTVPASNNVSTARSATGSSDTSPVLTIDKLSVGFGRKDSIEQVTQDVSLEIYKGETLALVGESGSGKSVTA
ncbi:ATP-binding cassette domain-containing protein, partial [Vibrio sp. 10N.261.49.A5]